MTAFARCEREAEWGTLSIELRSVNHRYLEVSMRLPEDFRALESKIREHIGAVLGRGKVDCALRYNAAGDYAGELKINRELATRLAHLSREVDGLLYNAAPVNSFDVLRWPGVMEVSSADLGPIHEQALGLLDEALAQLREAREREGANLKALIEQRCDAMEAAVPELRKRLPDMVERMRERLRERIAEVNAELEPGRLEQEIALLAQKMDVDEELDRLESHIGEVRRVLGSDEPVGRRLDFLMQELNREANTLASKSVDTGTTRTAVDLKVLIEQMREQIQNIE
jgi:uncharacterized protein (TIGR00255 family)